MENSQIESLLNEAVQQGATADQVRELHARITQPDLTKPVASGEFKGNQTDKNNGDTYYEDAKVASKPTPQQIDEASKLSRFYQGVKDPSQGIAQLILHALPDKGILKGSADYLDTSLSTKENQYQDARKAVGNDGIDWMRLGGNLTSQAPLMAIAPGGGTTLLGRAVAGAATGAGLNSTNPVTNKQDFWKEKGSQAGTGAAVGGVLAPASELTARFISPKVSGDVQTLLDEGVKPTVGQLLGGFYKTAEDKATSIPLLGDMITSARKGTISDLNKAVYNRALAPIGEKAGKEIGNEGILNTQQALSKAYDDVLPKLTLQPTKEFASSIGEIRDSVRPALLNDYDEILKSSVLSRLENGTLSNQALKDAESTLSSTAKSYTSSSDAAQRELGEKLKDTLSTLREHLEIQNPDFALTTTLSPVEYPKSSAEHSTSN